MTLQTHGGTAAATAIEARDRAFIASLQVDWNRDGLFAHALSDLTPYLDEVTTDRGLRGTAPEQLLLIEGSAAAELTAVIHGDINGLSLTGVFSPYNTASPLYGKDVVGTEIKYRIGVETSIGTVWYQQFIGFIRTIAPDRADGSVEITALDRAEVLRRPVTFPEWAVYSWLENKNGSYLTQLANSQWVIDHCLRQCDTSPTPYRPVPREELNVADSSPHGIQFWLTGTGASIPTVGWASHSTLTNFPTDASGAVMYRPIAEPHPASPEPSNRALALGALGAVAGDFTRFEALDREQIWSDRAHYAGFTLNTTGDGSSYYQTAPNHSVLVVNVGSRYLLNITINTGKIRSSFWSLDGGAVLSSGDFTIPTTGTHQRVEVIWDAFNASGPRVYLRCGTVGTNGFLTVGSPYAYAFKDDSEKGLVGVSHKVSLSDVYYGTLAGTPPNTSSAYVTRPARYAAVLDQGKNRLCHVAAKSGSDAWDVITDTAAAEFGAVFWDEQGVFKFWNQDRVVGLQNTIVRTLTLDDVTGLKLTNSLDSVRNIYSVQAKKYRSYYSRIYLSDDPDEFYTPGGTEKVSKIKIDNVVQPDALLALRRTGATWRDSDRHRYVAQWLKNGTWVEDDTRVGVDVRAYFDEYGTVCIEVWNGHNEPSRFAKNDGSPALAIGGTIVREEPPTTLTKKNLSSIAKYRGRNLELAGDWRQEPIDVAQLVNTMVTKTGQPTPATDAITIAGDPRLQLGDCIRIKDADAMGDLTLQIYGIRRTYSNSQGLADTLTVELVRPPT